MAGAGVGRIPIDVATARGALHPPTRDQDFTDGALRARPRSSRCVVAEVERMLLSIPAAAVLVGAAQLRVIVNIPPHRLDAYVADSLIRVSVCGDCHTDLDLAEGRLRARPLDDDTCIVLRGRAGDARVSERRTTLRGFADGDVSSDPQSWLRIRSGPVRHARH